MSLNVNNKNSQNYKNYLKEVTVKSMNLQKINLFFQQLQLAAKQKKLYFTFTKSRDLESILKILQTAHFISGYTKNTPDDFVKIFLSYDIQGLCVIKELKTVSSIKQRIIINTKQIRAYLNDYPYSLAIIRTRNGILSMNTCWANRVGGEVLAYIK